MLLCIHAVADESAVPSAGKEHVLGRVFMSNAERRRLDVLRKTQTTVENPGNASTTTAPNNSATENMPKPAGYIVPSNGSPYQWIDGDFQRVAKVEIDSASVSQDIRITRIELDVVDDSTPDELTPQVEDDNEPRIPH